MAFFEKMKRKIMLLTDRYLHSIKEDSFKQASDIFKLENNERIFSLLMALAYYAYVDSETVYDHALRKNMLSKISELSIELSELKIYNEKWVKLTGGSDELFKSLYQK